MRTEAQKYIETNLEHEILEKGIISSEGKLGISDAAFINKYKPNKWTFSYNFKPADAPYYASDIAIYQYNIMSRHGGFDGVMPGRIKRQRVINKITLQKTEGKTGDDLSFAFFNETPNGKSTKHIMDYFGLKASRVEKNGI